MDGDTSTQRENDVALRGCDCAGLRRWFDAHFPTRRSIGHQLRGQAIVIVVMEGGRERPYAIESEIGWKRSRANEGVKGAYSDSKTLTRAMYGKHPLSPKRLNQLEAHFPHIRNIRELPIWSFVMGDGAPFDTYLKSLDAFKYLAGDVYGLVCRRFQFHGRTFTVVGPSIISPSWFTYPGSENLCMALTLLGTLDAVTALCLFVRIAKGRFLAAPALQVARYIPAALAVYGTKSARALRLAILLFTQLRVSLLDGLVNEGEKLDLASYNIVAMSRKAKRWMGFERPSVISATVRDVDELIAIPRKSEAWLRQAMARVRTRDEATKVSIWARGMGPHAWLQSLPSSLKPLHQDAQKILETSFGPYWGNAP